MLSEKSTTNNGMCIESVSVDIVKNNQLYNKRMHTYKMLSVAFSYPDKDFFEFFPELMPEKESLIREYDRLFRVKEIWLYGAEYTSEHEFQKSNNLSDISGFYKAFGLEIDNDRPDSLEAELEFMHYLIFKEIKAPDKEKAQICADARRKFFAEHLIPMAKAIAQKIIAETENDFYKTAAGEILEFFAEEEKLITK